MNSALARLLLTVAVAATAAAAANPQAGKDKAESERCLECHGQAGPAQGFSQGIDGKLARLDGQYAEYLVKQVRDFRSGARKHDFMSMMANSVDDADLADIAAWFASQPAPATTPAPDAVAQRLISQSDPARGLIACATCHGADGAGSAGGAAAGPKLKGQGKAYLAQQLQEWRSGWRANSPGGVMNQQARALTDAEISALARYLSGQ